MFRKKKVVWLLLLPGLAGLMLFYVVPFFGGIYSSLMDGSFENQFVGLANYERTLQNSMFQLGLKNTWELSLLCAPVIWLLAFLLAAMLKTLKDRSTAFRNILLLPYLMPSSAMLLIWTLMFDYGGVINRMVTALGMERVLWLEGRLCYCTFGRTSGSRLCCLRRRCRRCIPRCMNTPHWKARAGGRSRSASPSRKLCRRRSLCSCWRG